VPPPAAAAAEPPAAAAAAAAAAGAGAAGDYDDAAGVRRLQELAVSRIAGAADQLALAALRLEQTVLLLRDLHYRDLPALSGQDVLDVELASAKR